MTREVTVTCRADLVPVGQQGRHWWAPFILEGFFQGGDETNWNGHTFQVVHVPREDVYKIHTMESAAKEVHSNIFYHGTSIEAALAIQDHGFDITLSGSNAGPLLGSGVYCTTMFEKAIGYAKGKEASGIVFELRVDLGRCKTLTVGDDMMQTWHQQGYDSAWTPQDTNTIGMSENCIKDPGRITIVRVIPVDMGVLKAIGMLVRPDGRITMIGEETGAARGNSGGHKSTQGQPAVDDELLALLRMWKLDGVADELAKEGIMHVSVLEEELPRADVEKLQLGRIYKNRLCKLLAHLKVARQEREVAQQKNTHSADSLSSSSACCSASLSWSPPASPFSAPSSPSVSPSVSPVSSPCASSPGPPLPVAPSQQVLELKERARQKESDVQQVLEQMCVRPACAIEIVHSRCTFVSQHVGCFELRKLAKDDPDKMTAIAAAWGIPMMLAAMTTHEKETHVQEKGCWALAILACNADNQKAIAAAGGIPVVLAAMTEHTRHAGVARLVTLGALAARIAAMKDAGVLEQGCRALANLALNEDNQKAIAAVGGIPAVLAAMTAYPMMGRAEVQEQGCSALKNLARNTGNRTAIAAAGGISVVLAAMTKHAGVQEHGCAVLCNIGWSDTTLQKRIKDEGGVVVVQAAVAASGTTADCKEHGKKLLGHLARLA